MKVRRFLGERYSTNWSNQRKEQSGGSTRRRAQQVNTPRKEKRRTPITRHKFCSFLSLFKVTEAVKKRLELRRGITYASPATSVYCDIRAIRERSISPPGSFHPGILGTPFRFIGMQASRARTIIFLFPSLSFFLYLKKSLRGEVGKKKQSHACYENPY